MESRPVTPLLDHVQTPADLKALSDRELHQLADERRAEVRTRLTALTG